MDTFDGASAGGTEAQFVQLLANLDRRRFAPSLSVFRPTESLREMASLDCPVTVLRIPTLAAPAAFHRLTVFSATLRRDGVRLVHIFLNDASLVAPAFCRLGGARVIVSRRDMGLWYRPSVLRVLRVSNLFVNRMIANSEAVQRNAHACEGFPLGRIDVVYNGFDPGRLESRQMTDLRERLGIGPSAPIVGMVANFHVWKRHADLLAAFALVRQRVPAAQLVLVGAGPPDTAARELAQSLGCAGAVHFLGAVADAIPVVRHFAIGVLCSDSEGLSNAVIEYMAAGKPTICTDVGGNAELIERNRAGVLIQPGDVPALADQIASLLTRPELRREMGERARLAAAALTSRRMAESHMNHYDNLLGRPVPELAVRTA
jgi:glycosyltransferase involved in cell wall biosynthesis